MLCRDRLQEHCSRMKATLWKVRVVSSLPRIIYGTYICESFMKTVYDRCSLIALGTSFWQFIFKWFAGSFRFPWYDWKLVYLVREMCRTYLRDYFSNYLWYRTVPVPLAESHDKQRKYWIISQVILRNKLSNNS